MQHQCIGAVKVYLLLLIYIKKLIKENIDFDLLLAGDGPHTQKLVSKLDKISSKNLNGWVKDISLFLKNRFIIIPSKFELMPKSTFRGN